METGIILSTIHYAKSFSSDGTERQVKIIKFWHKIWKVFSEEEILGLSPEG